jgi:putative ABC transport system permease protein
LGVALLVGINMATASAMNEFAGYINRFWGTTDIVVRYGSLAPFPDSALNTVKSQTDVTNTAARLEWPGIVTNSTIIQLVGIDISHDFDYSSLNITGTSSLLPGQTVITDSLAQHLGLNIGSTINISAINGSGQHVILQLTIVGLEHPYRTLAPTSYLGLQEIQSKLGLTGKVTHIYATIRDPSRVVVVRNNLQVALGRLFDVTAPKAEAIERINGQMAGFQLGLNIMVLVALVVCSFIVFNTLFMTVSERTYEIGVLRAVGTSRPQIFRIFLAEGVLIGLVSTVAGVLTGVGLSRFFVRVFENLGFPQLPEAVLTPELAVTGILAGLAAVLVGTIYPALIASRVDIVRAIRPFLQGPEGRGRYAITGTIGVLMLAIAIIQAFRFLPFHIPYLDIVFIPLSIVILGAVIYYKQGSFAKLFFSPVSRAVALMISRTGRRRLVRSTISFGMIAITLSFVIMIGGIQGGVQTSLEQGVREALGADIILVANQSVPVSFAQVLSNQPKISVATPLSPSFLPARALGPRQDATVGVLGIDPSQFPSIIAYNFLGSSSSNEAYQQLATSNETVLMPDSLASKLGVSTGDHLIIFSNNATTFTVVGIFTGPVLQYIRFGESYASDSIIVNLNSQSKYFGGKYESPIFLINVKPEYKHQTALVAQDLSSQYPRYDLGENSLTLDQLLGLVKTTVDKVFAVILLILYFAILITSLGIAVNMMMNVTERRREIGLLRSQGMSRGQVLWVFLGEGVILGIFGFLLAIPSGLLLLRGATNSTTVAGFWLPYVIPWTAMEESFVLAMTAVLLGTLYSAFKASHLEITRALQQA